MKLSHPYREILAIALPAIVANISTPLLSLVDVAITGHLGSADYLAAIALGGTIFNSLYWIFNFLRAGTVGITAQAYGADNGREQSLALFRSLTLSVVLSVVLLIFQDVLADTILDFMDAAEPSRTLARRYFKILIWGAPAVLATYAVSGWFLGVQNSKAQMIVSIATNLINIAASLFFVMGLHWKIDAVATGTLIAQYAGLAIALAIAFKKYHPQVPGLQEILDTEKLGTFFRINFDIFLRTLCLVAVTMWFTHAGAEQGTDILAGNALLLQLFMLFSFFVDGFAFAAEALVGKFVGRNDEVRLNATIRRLMTIAFAFAVTFSILYLFAGESILALLADSPSVLSSAKDFLPWAAIVPLCGFAAFIWDGVYIGLIRTRAMLFALAIAAAVFFAVYFSAPIGTNNTLWLAFNAYLLTRGVAQTLFYVVKHR